MEIVVHSKKSLFQQTFQRNSTISTGIPNLKEWWSNDLIGRPESELDKKIRLRLPVVAWWFVTYNVEFVVATVEST